MALTQIPSKKGKERAFSVKSTDDVSSCFPSEIWLKIAEHCPEEVQFTLSFCNKSLWNTIHHYLHPIQALQKRNNIDRAELPFSLFTLRKLHEYFPRHITCPICTKFHYFTQLMGPICSYNTATREHSISFNAWKALMSSNFFASAFQIGAAEWLFWTEARLIMEKAQFGDFRPLQDLNNRCTSGMWERGRYERQQATGNPLEIQWWGRAIFQVVDQLLLMREENRAIVASSTARWQQVRLNGPALAGMKSTARPCNHDRKGFGGLDREMELLRRKARWQMRNNERWVSKDMFCRFCPTAYTFMVKTTPSCPKGWTQRCQQVCIVRWVNYGGFGSLKELEWNCLQDRFRDCYGHNMREPPTDILFGRKIADSFEGVLPSRPSNPIGASVELPSSHRKCYCSAHNKEDSSAVSSSSNSK